MKLEEAVKYTVEYTRAEKTYEAPDSSRTGFRKTPPSRRLGILYNINNNNNKKKDDQQERHEARAQEVEENRFETRT